MKIDGDYHQDGYAGVTGLIPPEVAQAFLGLLKSDLDQSGVPLNELRQTHNLLKREATELYAYHYPPMLMFLWGLTPTVANLTGIELLPTYAYLRFYRRGDVCRVHQDRHACQHSISLTLGYSDGLSWPLEIGRQRFDEPSARVTEDFGEESFGAVAMRPGDAVLYQGRQPPPRAGDAEPQCLVRPSLHALGGPQRPARAARVRRSAPISGADRLSGLILTGQP